MHRAADVRYSLCMFYAGIDTETLEHMILETIQRRSVMSPQTKARLEGAIQRKVQVDGFRPLYTPPSLLVKEIRHRVDRDDSLARAVLLGWMDIHSELEEALRRFLESRCIETIDRPALELGLLGIRDPKDTDEVLSEFYSAHPKLEYDDILMMCSAITGWLSGVLEDPLHAEPTSNDHSDEPFADTRLSLWLSELEKLPADAPEWDNAAAFADRVRELGAFKLKERETGRQHLQSALEALRSLPSDLFHYLELAVPTNWTADDLALQDCAPLAIRVQDMRELLLELQDLKEQPGVSTRSDRIKRQEQMQELEERIIAAYKELNPQLGSEFPSKDPPPSPGGSAGIMDEEAGTEVVISGTDESSSIAGYPQAPTTAVTVETRQSESTEPNYAEVTAEPESSGDQALVEEEIIVGPRTKETVADLVPEADLDQNQTDVDPTTWDFQPLLSSHDAAKLIQTESPDECWNTLLWAFIAEDDVPGAYWLARSLEAAGKPLQTPSWLLAAVHGARRVGTEYGQIVSDLFTTARDHQPDSDDTAQALLGLAAAICPSLLAPSCGLQSWVFEPRAVPGLHGLVAAVQSFADSGIALRPEDLRGIANREEREASIVAAAREVREWLEVAPGRKLLYQGASVTWKSLVQPGGPLNDFLGQIGADRRDQVDVVRHRLREWDSRDEIGKRVDERRSELKRGHGAPVKIVGGGRDQLIRFVEEALELAARWCGLVERERKIDQRGSWWSNQIQTLRSQLSESLPAAHFALQEFAKPCQTASVDASARCLMLVIRHVGEMFGIRVPHNDTGYPVIQIDSNLLNGDSLAGTLSPRLLWLPEIAMDDDGKPLPDEVTKIADALLSAAVNQRTIAQAFEGWLQGQDYRFVDVFKDALRDHPEAETLSRRAWDNQRGSQAALVKELDRANADIEQSLVYSIITEEERAYLSSEISALVPEDIRNFRAAHKRVERLRLSLEEAKTERLAALRETWEDLQLQIESQPLALGAPINEPIEAAFNTRDIRLLDEYLAQIRAQLGGDSPEDIWVREPETNHTLEEFDKENKEIGGWLQVERLPGAIKAVEAGRSAGGMNFGQLSPKRHKEIISAIRAWQKLKSQPLDRPQSKDHVATILQYLGFIIDVEHSPSVVGHTAEPGWARFDVFMSASNLAKPIPQFGSQAHGFYHVVCLRDKPGAETIEARLRELGLTAKHVLVFSLGQLSRAHRIGMMRLARNQELGIAVLDETLLLFLAQERDARLPAFLRVALPYAFVNPYTEKGDAPSEMFFGRDRMVRDLQQPGGACLVYGGRQLGKSTLLRHVQRQFNNPAEDHHAWIIDMKRIFERAAGKHTDNIWRALRDGFIDHGLFPTRSHPEKKEAIIKQIRSAMREPRRRVLVMFDEADEFLDYDAKDNSFREVIELRDLMNETERRFKVVFAGLHDVQRFQGIPNQPLAHFGTPIRVGPLEPKSARQLIREPLEALGYRLDQETVLRILCYTNYHPGLIQLFCRELLGHLRLHSEGVPPITIKREDVEAVYRKHAVRRGIRERFEWTLALDPRYQAVAWALVVDQMEVGNGYDGFYHASDILTKVREWWPDGFVELSSDAYRGILNEMCGLGVLARNGSGHYGLRSPNVVRLMGSESDIENRLLELSDRPAPQPYDDDNDHVQLEDSGDVYSPFTFTQERALNLTQYGVGLVFASEPLGLTRIPDVIRRFASTDSGFCSEIPGTLRDPKLLDDWLNGCRKAHDDVARVMVWQLVKNTSPEVLAELVQAAKEFCRRHQQSRAKWMRVFFVFDPEGTRSWLEVPQALRAHLENTVDAVVVPRRWNHIALKTRLNRRDWLGNEDICRYLVEATGGWPTLLDELFARSKSQDDLRPTSDEISRELRDSKSSLSVAFLSQLKLNTFSEALQVLHFLFQEKDSVPEELVPEFIPSPAPTADTCARAIEFLRRMGCIETEDSSIRLEPTIRAVLTTA